MIDIDLLVLLCRGCGVDAVLVQCLLIACLLAGYHGLLDSLLPDHAPSSSHSKVGSSSSSIIQCRQLPPSS